MVERSGHGDLRASLLALLGDGALELPADLGGDTPLISSGLLESTTLLNVALWVEDHLGREVELGSFDLVAEWDSMNAILDFVKRHRSDAAIRGSRPG